MAPFQRRCDRSFLVDRDTFITHIDKHYASAQTQTPRKHDTPTHCIVYSIAWPARADALRPLRAVDGDGDGT